MVDKCKVIGRRILNVLKTQSTFGPAAVVPGITREGDVMEVFDIYLELDGGQRLRIGRDHSDDPLTLYEAEGTPEPVLGNYVMEAEETCVGDRIVNVHIRYSGYVIELESGRLLWLQDDITGTGLVVMPKEEYLKGRDQRVLFQSYW